MSHPYVCLLIEFCVNLKLWGLLYFFYFIRCNLDSLNHQMLVRCSCYSNDECCYISGKLMIEKEDDGWVSHLSLCFLLEVFIVAL